MLNLSRSSDLVCGGRDGKGCGGIRGDTRSRCFSGLFQGFVRPASAWQSHLSARRGAAVVSAAVTGRSGDVRRYRAVRREEDRPFSAGSGRFAMERLHTITSENCEDNPRPPRYTPLSRSRRPRDQCRKWKHWVTSSLATVRRTAEGGWLSQSSM